MVPGEQYDGSTGDRVPGHRRHAHLRTLTHDVRVLAAPGHRHDEILTPAALDFIGRLAAAFGERRQALLKERRRQVLRLASGSPLDFPMVTSAVRADPTWRVAPPAPGLTDRRVEITGPPDRRMAVNALDSGAKVWMADFEDATAPLWENIVGGQLTLLDAIERRIDFTTPEGKEYRLEAPGRLATTVVRPRGRHLDEEHLQYDGTVLHPGRLHPAPRTADGGVRGGRDRRPCRPRRPGLRFPLEASSRVSAWRKPSFAARTPPP